VIGLTVLYTRFVDKPGFFSEARLKPGAVAGPCIATRFLNTSSNRVVKIQIFTCLLG